MEVNMVFWLNLLWASLRLSLVIVLSFVTKWAIVVYKMSEYYEKHWKGGILKFHVLFLHQSKTKDNKFTVMCDKLKQQMFLNEFWQTNNISSKQQILPIVQLKSFISVHSYNQLLNRLRLPVIKDNI